MMKCKLFLILCVSMSGILFIQSCKRKVNVSDSKIKEFRIPENVEDKTFKWPDSTKIISCVKLETTDSSVVALARKVDVVNDKIIIYDNRNINVFDKNTGKSLFVINFKGKAPGEYIDLRDFYYDSKTHVIALLDYKKILYYDIDTHKYIKTEKVPEKINPMKFIEINGTKYFWECKTKQNYNLSCYNNKKLKGLLSLSPHYLLDGDRFIREYNDGFMLIPPMGDYNLYTITKAGLSIKYKIDFGKLSLPKDVIMTKTNQQEIYKNPYFKWIQNVYETEDWLYMYVAGPKLKCYDILINKNNNKVLGGALNANDFLRIVGSDEKYFYALMEPQFILNAKKGSFIYQLKDIDITEDDNPVLIKILL